MVTAAAAAAAGVGALAPAASAATAPTTVVRKVAGGSVNLRMTASTSSKSRGKLAANAVVNGTLSNGWVHITSPKAYAGAYVSDSVLVYGGARASSKPACGSQDRKDGGYVLCRDYVGVKAYTTRQKLGLRVTNDVKGSTLGADAIAALEKFQGDHKLPVTGEVDRATFTALGGGSFDMDAWINPASSSRDHIGAMISWAAAQVNKPYIWGGLGQTGYDCSGLVLQALRAGGFKPSGAIDNLTDILPASDLSRRMWGDATQIHPVGGLTYTNLGAMLAKAKRGDIVFYAKGSWIGHVGIYAGGGTVIDAAAGKVRVERNPSPWKYDHFGLARPFN